MQIATRARTILFGVLSVALASLIPMSANAQTLKGSSFEDDPGCNKGSRHGKDCPGNNGQGHGNGNGNGHGNGNGNGHGNGNGNGNGNGGGDGSNDGGRFKLLAKSPVDACFQGILGPFETPAVNGQCTTGRPKRNQAYVWGMANQSGFLYWGTGANVACTLLADPNAKLPPIQSDGLVCEFRVGALKQGKPQLQNLGDWRAPTAYRMNKATERVEDITSTIRLSNGQVDPNLNDVLGFRSGGAHNNVVFLAGPAGASIGGGGPIGADAGISMFAWQADTGRYLGSKLFPRYNNIRQFIVQDGVLYTGASLIENEVLANGVGGEILRWNGNVKNPFDFIVVGTTKAEPANFAFHEGRLFATTWPDVVGANVRAVTGVVMSPPVPKGGFGASRTLWKEVWNVNQYEPDPVTAGSYAGGSIESWKGQLYWGTMHFPLSGLAAHGGAYGTPGGLELVATAIATTRATSVYRGSNFGTANQDVQLLYGDLFVPAYDPAKKRFVLAPTKAGVPRFGFAGFNWFFNSYVWTAGTTKGDMFMGTFDSSRILGELMGVLGTLTGVIDAPIPPFIFNLLQSAISNPVTSGADMFRWNSPLLPPIPSTTRGGGNPVNYGFRTMSNEEDFMWLGTANPFNLDPRGGWEVMKFTPIDLVP